MEKTIENIRYSNYYFDHTYCVVLAWIEIRELLLEKKLVTEDEIIKINNLIAWHDNSKISEEEFDGYRRKFFPGPEDTDYELIKSDFKKAWEHHKQNNLHHHQTLKDYKGNDWKCYVIDLLCDWIAMGWQHNNSAYEYYMDNKESIVLPEEYKIFLEEVLNCLNDYYKEVFCTPSKERMRDVFPY